MAVAEMTETGAPVRFRITPVFWVSLLVVFVISLPNLMDPMIRHDDYPALLGLADVFWNKTLHEGRWLNYIWHLREILTPAWLNFAIYQICWAIFATGLAVAASSKDQRPIFAAMMAGLIVVAPPATLISAWFNTLQPGLALVALYAVIVCKTSDRTARLLLPVFVVLTFMAYTTYPLLLLALCLARTRNRSLLDLALLLALFGASFVGAVLVTYTLNWHVHGVFGVPLADWRAAVPAESLSGLRDNLSFVKTTFIYFSSKTSFNSNEVFYAHVACLTLATLVLTRRAPLETLYLLAGLLTGLTLIVLQSMKLGIVVPSRALIFVWVFYAVIFSRAVQLLNLQNGTVGRAGIAASLVAIFAFGAQAFERYSVFDEWREATWEIAAQLENRAQPVYVLGSPKLSDIGRSASIQSDMGFYYRMMQVSDVEFVMCDGTDPTSDCAELDRSTLQTDATAGWEITQTDNRTLLIFREVPEDDAD